MEEKIYGYITKEVVIRVISGYISHKFGYTALPECIMLDNGDIVIKEEYEKYLKQLKTNQ